MKRLFLAASAAFLFSSCALLPMSTDAWINRKLDNIPMGSSKELVAQRFGNPIYRIKFPEASHVEIWGYDLGHYWYHESITMFFKEGMFIGVPRTPYDLMALMRQLRLVDPAAQFMPGHTVSS
jgi:hypothetical protein